MTTLLRLLVPYSRRVMLAMALGATVIASNMGLLAAAAYLIAAASVAHLMALLVIPMYAVRILSATRGSARYAERLVSHRVTFDVLARLRVQVYDRLRQLGPAGLGRTRSGDSLGRVLADVENLQDAYLLFISPIAVAFAVSALTVGILLAFSGTIALTALCYLTAGALVLPMAVALLTRTAGAARVRSRAELNAHLVDSIQGVRDIVSNGAGSRFLEVASIHSRRLARSEARLVSVSGAREGAAELLMNLAMLTALALTVPLVTGHSILGVYLAVPALLVLAAYEAIRPLGQAAESVSGVRAAGGRVRTIGERLPGSAGPVCEPSRPALLQSPFSVTFENVSLHYTDSRRPAVSGVSFEVAAGRRVAVVGPSGAGKSSLVHLLTRAWDPATGHVRVGGRDIRDCSLRDLRSVLGVVTQDSYIFNDSVRSNLLLARPDAAAADLEAALDAVGLLELVHALPRGLDTWVGEHGERLSGGERQRLAVARVILQNAPIVVLDEVTANLDPVTEASLLETLDRVTQDRTVLFITHRLVEMDRMDEIVVLDRGRLIECGRHESLAAAGGVYASMLAVQANMLAIWPGSAQGGE